MVRLLRFWRLGGSNLRLLWCALRHPDRPAWLLPATVLLGVFALEPFNFAIPFLGVLDDFIVLPLLLDALLRMLPAHVRAGDTTLRSRYR